MLHNDTPNERSHAIDDNMTQSIDTTMNFFIGLVQGNLCITAGILYAIGCTLVAAVICAVFAFIMCQQLKKQKLWLKAIQL